MKAGWREPIMFYRFKCKIHGDVVNYPMGYAERLLCPVCLEAEIKAVASSESTQES